MGNIRTVEKKIQKKIDRPSDVYLIIFTICSSLIGAIALIFAIDWLLVISGITLSFVILIRPFWGLLLFTVLLPLESSFLALGVGVTTVTRILGIYIFGVWLINVIINKKKISFPKMIFIAYALFFWGAISLLWAYDKSAALGRVQTAVQLAMLLLLVVNFINSQKRLKALIFALFLGCLIITLLGLTGVGVADYSVLLTLGGQGAKEYGSFVGIVLLIGSILLLFEKGKKRWFGFGAAIISIIGLIQVNQRGVLLGIGATWLGLTIVTKQKFKTIFLILLLLLLFNFSIDILFNKGVIDEHLVSRLTVENVIETGGTGRSEIWKTGWRMFADNVFLGVGLNNFPTVYHKYASPMDQNPFRDPHGDVIAMAGELGIVGVVLYLIFCSKLVAGIFSGLVNSKNFQSNLIALVVFSLLIYYFSVGLTSTLIWRKINWVVYGMGVAVTYLMTGSSGEKKTN